MVINNLLLSEQPAALALASIIAIRCRHELAIRQLLQHIYRCDSKVSTRLVQKIWYLLQPDEQAWLSQTIAPGMSYETYSEATARISKNTT